MAREKIKITVVFETLNGVHHNFEGEATIFTDSLKCLVHIESKLRVAAGKVYFERLRERFPHGLTINPFAIPHHRLKRGYDKDAADLVAKVLKQIGVPKTRYRLLKHDWFSDLPLHSEELTLMLADADKPPAVRLMLPEGMVRGYVTAGDAV